MNEDDIKKQLFDWIETFVEKPNPKLGDWSPCPYARQARINNKIGVLFSNVDNLLDSVRISLSELETKDVVVICFDHKKISATLLQEWINEINDSLLIPNDWVILEDHPDAIEYVNGVKMNFGECGLLIVQKLSKLNDASSQLKEKGYYNHWDKQSLDYVVNWRNK